MTETLAETIKILCVDDEISVLRALKRLFVDEDYVLLTAASAEEGLEILAGERVHIVVSDYRMPGMNGVDFLKRVYEQWPDAIRIVLSGYADTATVVAAINEGHIYKFIPKPWNNDELKVSIAKAVEVYFLYRKNVELNTELLVVHEKLRLAQEGMERLVQERIKELTLQNKILNRAQGVLYALPVAVIDLDPQGVIIQANHKAGELIGRETISLTGRTAESVFPAEIIAFIRQAAAGQARRERVLVAGRELLVAGAVVKDPEAENRVLVVFWEGDRP